MNNTEQTIVEFLTKILEQQDILLEQQAEIIERLQNFSLPGVDYSIGEFA